MPRYFAQRRPSQWFADDLGPEDAGMVKDLTVPEHVATDTGLLDVDGNPIMRAPNPVGFGRDGEW